MSSIDVANTKQFINEIIAANALLTLKRGSSHLQTEAGNESAGQDLDDNYGLNLVIGALLMFRKTNSMPTVLQELSKATSPADNMQNETASPNTSSSKTSPDANPSDINNAQDPKLPTAELSAKTNSPTAQHTSDDDIDDSKSQTLEKSSSPPSSFGSYSSDSNRHNSESSTPETSGSQTSPIALSSSDNDGTPDSVYLTQDLNVTCPHCKELFPLEHSVISPKKDSAAPKADLSKDIQESAAETSKPLTTSVEKTEALAVKQERVKRKRDSSFGSSYSESPEKMNKSDFAVNYGNTDNTPWKIKKGSVNDGRVPIGNGYASVPIRLLKSMNWNSYTNATRKLLTAVFPRRVLATHSLTGKKSPAFPDKPAKKQLNPALIDDIVKTVVEKCNVPGSIVRTSIRTKCADESKRLRSQQPTSKNKNQENLLLLKKETDDSDDSYE